MADRIAESDQEAKGSRPRAPTVFLSLAPCCRDEECQSLVRSVNDNFIHEVATARSPHEKKKILPGGSDALKNDFLIWT